MLVRGKYPNCGQSRDTYGAGYKYHRMSPEEAIADGQRYDVVLNMEVIEHVADINVFMEACGALVQPGAAWSARH